MGDFLSEQPFMLIFVEQWSNLWTISLTPPRFVCDGDESQWCILVWLLRCPFRFIGLFVICLWFNSRGINKLSEKCGPFLWHVYLFAVVIPKLAPVGILVCLGGFSDCFSLFSWFLVLLCTAEDLVNYVMHWFLYGGCINMRSCMSKSAKTVFGSLLLHN